MVVVPIEDCFVNFPQKRKAIIIHKKLTRGTIDEVESLLDEYPDILNGLGEEFAIVDGVPLITAIKHDRQDVAAILLRRGADINIHTMDVGIAPLHVAVAIGSLPFAQMLIENGADVNIRNQVDLCPLHVAVGMDNVDMVNLLLSKGADPNAVTVDRAPIKGLVYLTCYTEMEENLFVYQMGYGQLCNSIRNASRSEKESYGRSDQIINLRIAPLHMAVGNSSNEIIGVLLKNGADINMKNKNDLTPLKIALKTNKQIVEKLLDSGATFGADLEEVSLALTANKPDSALFLLDIAITNGHKIANPDNSFLMSLVGHVEDCSAGIIKGIIQKLLLLNEDFSEILYAINHLIIRCVAYLV